VLQLLGPKKKKGKKGGMKLYISLKNKKKRGGGGGGKRGRIYNFQSAARETEKKEKKLFSPRFIFSQGKGEEKKAESSFFPSTRRKKRGREVVLYQFRDKEKKGKERGGNLVSYHRLCEPEKGDDNIGLPRSAVSKKKKERGGPFAF